MASLAEQIGGKNRVIGGPFGSNLTQKDYALAGVPVIRGSNMGSGGKGILGPFAYVSEEKFGRDLKANAAKPGDIIVTQRGTLGQVAILPDNAPHSDYVVSQSQMAIRVDRSKVDRDFVYYFLTSPLFNEYVATVTIQTGVPHINLGILRDVEVDWPPLTEQRAIAATLGALDDKIDLNRRMNETLEAMARALFRDWFIDFGPTRAKMAGLAPYLSPALWDLFPARLDDDGKPEGWKVKPLSDAFDLLMGQSPPGDTYNDDADGLPFFQGRTDFGFRFPENRKYCSAPTRVAEKGDTLVSVRAPVGDINIAAERCCIGRGVAALRHKDDRPSFTYYTAWALQEELRQYENTGTVFGAINRKQFEALPTVDPGSDLLNAFEETASAMDHQIKRNERETRTLAQTRDLLLPRLMSGELRVAEAEQTLAEVL